MSDKKIYLPPLGENLVIDAVQAWLTGSVSATYDSTLGDNMSLEMIDENGLWQ